MADAFVPYAPLNVPKPFADAVWIVDGPEIAMDYLGLKLPFPTRMTVVRLPDGGLWLHSPIAFDQGLAASIAAFGPVRHLIAPNTLHYWWIPDWAARFPEAQLHAAPGLDKAAKRPLPPHRVLGDAPDPAWTEVIDQLLVPGGLLTEVDFLHRPSRTLILTDLIENFEPRRIRPRWLRALVRWSGAADPDGKAPIDMQLSFWRHKRTLRSAVRRMIDWAPEQIVLAHGRCYDRDGTVELKRAFRWAL
ncbi:DUF4336 domain-containing protein [Sphingomonas sp. MAH-20]|uniref:DUF4336 domain-containing protein n=1 Tax=Sphingomonas horti TaxID=2682842 RepID=A0A6I4J2C2_9SPHN|nr:MULTISPECIES: DUF4336 domain-containing protein [Sphingomonas]MBA2919705.1 DUF4336 domain-containing protein [Sphingomonas sp. CGMCC 1.13658]MVO78585.1 DUF4336 domain-containing protein [Sphingomonas horti]